MMTLISTLRRISIIIGAILVLSACIGKQAISDDIVLTSENTVTTSSTQPDVDMDAIFAQNESDDALMKQSTARIIEKNRAKESVLESVRDVPEETVDIAEEVVVEEVVEVVVEEVVEVVVEEVVEVVVEEVVEVVVEEVVSEDTESSEIVTEKADDRRPEPVKVETVSTKEPEQIVEAVIVETSETSSEESKTEEAAETDETFKDPRGPIDTGEIVPIELFVENEEGRKLKQITLPLF